MTTIQQDLIRLEQLKSRAAKLSRDQKAANSEAKSFEQHVLMRMDGEEVDGLKSGGFTFSHVDKDVANVEDKDAFIRWALENDEALQEFLVLNSNGTSDAHLDAVLDSLITTLMYLDLLKLEPRGDRLNALVRNRLDDGEVMPPGLGHRPADYVSIRKS